MRKKIIKDFPPDNTALLQFVLADIFAGLGNSSGQFYLVGGLVPVFLVMNKLDYLKEYLGTLDIDLAVEVAVKRAVDLYACLRAQGFEKQRTEDGLDAMSHSFIKHLSGKRFVVLDLITDNRFEPRADKLKEISPNVEAVKFRGVYLVFQDYLIKQIKRRSGVAVSIKIPNIIPFLTLKSLAYADPDNSASKDAFDIWYTVVNYGAGPNDVNKELLKYAKNSDVKDAFRAISGFFKDESSKGTKDVRNILTTRYGLSLPQANREVLSPFKMLIWPRASE